MTPSPKRPGRVKQRNVAGSEGRNAIHTPLHGAASKAHAVRVRVRPQAKVPSHPLLTRCVQLGAVRTRCDAASTLLRHSRMQMNVAGWPMGSKLLGKWYRLPPGFVVHWRLAHRLFSAGNTGG